MKGMLSCDRLLDILHASFSKVKGPRLRTGSISLKSCLLSAYAMFSLKYPSLLQFDQHVREDIITHNLRSIYRLHQIPSDSQMRERLDEVDPNALREPFKRLFAQCQKSKYLELFQYHEGRYLVSLDGTGYFYSKKVHCEQCCEKHHSDGSTSYYHQMLSGTIVHPDQRVVLPFAPEMIMKIDGLKKKRLRTPSSRTVFNAFKKRAPSLIADYYRRWFVSGWAFHKAPTARWPPFYPCGEGKES